MHAIASTWVTAIESLTVPQGSALTGKNLFTRNLTIGSHSTRNLTTRNLTTNQATAKVTIDVTNVVRTRLIPR